MEYIFLERMGKDKRITRATPLRPCLLLLLLLLPHTHTQGMEAKFLSPLIYSRLPPQRCLLNEPSTLRIPIPLRATPHRLQHIKVHTSNSDNNSTGNNGDTLPPISTPPPSITPPDTVEVRFQRGSKKRSRSKQRQEFAGPISKQPPPPPPKKWESMTFAEKALELYMGEKGLLFWLNKFAYASIYIIIGAWILFRFVGPSLGFYQLDSPALTPSSLFK